MSKNLVNEIYVSSFIKSHLEILKNVEEKVITNNLLLSCGFYDTYDIIFSVYNNKFAYSLYSNFYYKGLHDLDCLKKIREYENSQITAKKVINDYNDINTLLRPTGVFIWTIDNPQKPEKWLEFLKNFYKKFFKNEESLQLSFDYSLLMVRTMLIQAPIIMNMKIYEKDYLFVGYRFPEYHQFSMPFGAAQAKIIEIDLDYIRDCKDEKKIFYYFLNNMRTTSFFIDDLENFCNKYGLDLNKNSTTRGMVFDFIFIVPKFLFIYLMPFLFKLVLESTLRFPLLINSTELIEEETEKEYKKIVDDEFESILVYLLLQHTENSYKSLILDNLINKKII